MYRFLLITALMIGFVGDVWAQATAQEGVYSVQLEQGVDDESEGCYVFAWLVVNGPEGQRRKKLCGAQDVQSFRLGERPVFVMKKAGGHAAGWGLYRYWPKTDRLEEYAFNAREIEVKADKRELRVTVKKAVHAPEGGYLLDRVEHWVWSEGTPQPSGE